LGTAKLSAKYYGKPDIAAIDNKFIDASKRHPLSLFLSISLFIAMASRTKSPSSLSTIRIRYFFPGARSSSYRKASLDTALQAIQEMRFISLETSAPAYQNSLSSIEYIVLCGDWENML
jgi:hypothetical protein